MNVIGRLCLRSIAIIPGAALFCGTGVFADDDGGGFIFPTLKDYPQIRSTGQKLSDFIPKGWTIVSKASGDLDGDGRNDIAAVILGHSKKFVQDNTIAMGSPTFDTNPKVLIVLFSQPNGGYKLAEQSNTIEIRYAPAADEPFDAVKIRNGILSMYFHEWTSAGSWSESNTSYKFRWQHNKFVLIGADYHWDSRGTGETDNNSYDFLSGKEKMIHKGMLEKTSKTSWKNFQSKGPPALRSFATYDDLRQAINNGD